MALAALGMPGAMWRRMSKIDVARQALRDAGSLWYLTHAVHSVDWKEVHFIFDRKIVARVAVLMGEAAVVLEIDGKAP